YMSVVSLPAVGEVVLGVGFRLSIRQVAASEQAAFVPGLWRALFDADGLAAAGGGPLVLRTWRPGDRILPLGAPGARKLQDVLVDGKIPRAVRPTLPLLAQEPGAVLWVPGPGGRRSAHAPVGPATREILVFEFIQED